MKKWQLRLICTPIFVVLAILVYGFTLENTKFLSLEYFGKSLILCLPAFLGYGYEDFFFELGFFSKGKPEEEKYPTKEISNKDAHLSFSYPNLFNNGFVLFSFFFVVAGISFTLVYFFVSSVTGYIVEIVSVLAIFIILLFEYRKKKKFVQAYKAKQGPENQKDAKA